MTVPYSDVTELLLQGCACCYWNLQCCQDCCAQQALLGEPLTTETYYKPCNLYKAN